MSTRTLDPLLSYRTRLHLSNFQSERTPVASQCWIAPRKGVSSDDMTQRQEEGFLSTPGLHSPTALFLGKGHIAPESHPKFQNCSNSARALKSSLAA